MSIQNEQGLAPFTIEIQEEIMAKALFDRGEVLDKSISLFWKYGFSASSMQQVVKATGLKPGSIYLSFGNKESLFRESLERYAQRRKETIRTTIENAPSVSEGICIHLENLMREAEKNDFYSCMLVKSQLELAHGKRELHEFTAIKLTEVEALFSEYLEKEFSPDLSRERAASIMLHIFGMRVYGYLPDGLESMEKGSRAGLDWLPWSGRPPIYQK